MYKWDYEKQKKSCFCFIGAFVEAYTRLGWLGRPCGDAHSAMIKVCNTGFLNRWNDEKGRTLEDVIQAIEKAKDILESESIPA